MEMFSQKKINERKLEEFADYLLELSEEIGFKVSSRGWAYLLETRRFINKDQFDRVTTLINKCRQKGYLPIDFVAEEEARSFKGVELPNDNDIVDDFGLWLEAAKKAPEHYNPDWWNGENYYIQMVVEKIDLVTLFSPVCRQYHIPIANAKGWSSMLQRAEYARRFAQAENNGLQCVLLYCGDHDPDGLRISEFIRNNLDDLKHIRWSDGLNGFDPQNLIIDRFGLNFDFIEFHKLTWIDNLITGSGLNLASPTHRNHKMPYVQEYLQNIGKRKCEANAVVTMPQQAQQLVRNAIEKYLGSDARDRFESKRQQVRDDFNQFLTKSGLGESIDGALKIIKNR